MAELSALDLQSQVRIPMVPLAHIVAVWCSGQLTHRSGLSSSETIPYIITYQPSTSCITGIVPIKLLYSQVSYRCPLAEAGE